MMLFTAPVEHGLPVVNGYGPVVSVLCGLLLLLSRPVAATQFAAADGAQESSECKAGAEAAAGFPGCESGEPTLELILFLGEWQPQSEQWYEQMQSLDELNQPTVPAGGAEEFR